MTAHNKTDPSRAVESLTSTSTIRLDMLGRLRMFGVQLSELRNAVPGCLPEDYVAEQVSLPDATPPADALDLIAFVDSEDGGSPGAYSRFGSAVVLSA